MARKSSVQHRKLSRLLRRAPAEIVEPVKEVIAESAQQILLDAESEIPVDSGLAKDVMTAKASRSGLSAEIGFLTARARKLAFYAAFVHWGTAGSAERNIKPRSENQFLFRPAERRRPEIVKRIDAVVDKVLERLSRG